MNVPQMRDALADVYPNSSWADKVANMSDKQVVAVYLKFKVDGVFDKKPDIPPGEKRYNSIYNAFEAAKNENGAEPVDTVNDETEQLSLF